MSIRQRGRVLRLIVCDYFVFLAAGVGVGTCVSRIGYFCVPCVPIGLLDGRVLCKCVFMRWGCVFVFGVRRFGRVAAFFVGCPLLPSRRVLVAWVLGLVA